MKTLITSLAAVLLMTACSNSKNMSTTNKPLYDTKWLLKEIVNNGSTEQVNTKAFIRFDQAKASAGGNGSCNSFGSNAAVNGSEVKFSNIFSTKMYCEAVQQIENKFLGSLEQVNNYKINGNMLSLYKDKELLLQFTAE